MRLSGERAKWARPWLTGFWVVILLTTLTVPSWAESVSAGITQNLGRTVAEPGEVNVLKDVGLDTSVPLGEPSVTIPEFPKGRLQPYLTVGPREDSADFFPPEQQPDTDTSVRVKAGAGLSWSPLTNIAIFGEYRPELQFTDRAESVTRETDVNTHHFVGGGISLRF